MRSACSKYAVVILLTLAAAGCDALRSPQQRIALARTELAQGKWGSAAIELRKVVQSEPGNATAWLLLARVSLDAADPGDAQVDLGKALKFGARGAEADHLRARTWIATGQARALITALTTGELPLAEPERSLWLAKAYNAVNEPQKALATLAPALNAKPVPTAAALAAAVAQGEQGHSDEALARTQAASAADPRSFSAPLFAGKILAARGDATSARNSFALALQRMPAAAPLPDRAEALMGLAEAQLALGDVPAAASSSGVLSALLPSAPISQLLAARIKLVRGEQVDGIAELERLVANVPNYVKARLLLGAAQFQRGDLEQAQQNLDIVVRQVPENIEARELLASVRLKMHQPGQALDVLAAAVGSHPLTPQLYGLLGAAGRATGQPEAALQVIEKAAGAHPENLMLSLNLARAYLAAKRAPDALALLEKTDVGGENQQRDALLLLATGATQGSAAVGVAVERLLAAHPQEPAIVDLAASYYASVKNYERAGNLVQGALDRDPNNAPLLVTLARIDLAKGEFANANAALDRVIANRPGDATLTNAAGTLLMQANQYDAALARFRAAIQLDDTKPLFWYEAGRAQLALDEPAAARESLERAAKLAPAWIAPASALAYVDLVEKQPQRAVARADALLAIAPKDPDAFALKGSIEAELRNYPAAETALSAAQRMRPTAMIAVRLFNVRRLEGIAHPEAVLDEWLQQHPDDASVRTELGIYQLSQHALQPAAHTLEAAIGIAPNDAVALNDLAWIYAKLGDSRAESVAERAYRLTPDQPAVADTLGWILAGKHEAAKALPLVALAAKVNATDPSIQYHYAYVLAETGQKAAARAILAKILGGKAPFEDRPAAAQLYARL